MAAGQQKRRLNAVNLASCNIPEQHREKKRKDAELSPSILRLNPQISLEWKENGKRAVARNDQVGISWRDLSPFIDASQQPRSHPGLADVFTVPQEIFGLDNLQGLLSYEAWKMYLSESERKLLLRFLPKGIDVDQLLQSLLNGENFHFGNPFLEWGSLLCSGNVHPDASIQRELSFKANKKGYYSELQKYHDDMIEELQVWKETWISSRDPENIQKILRSGRNNIENSSSSHANESAPLSLRENVGVSTDSGSSIGDEKNDIWDKRYEDFQERLPKPKVGRSVSISTNKKVDNNIGKDEKQMSGSQQHLVKKLKQSAGSLKFKSLNWVLGDAKKLEKGPCGALEEENKDLHNHWLHIACTEIVAAYTSHLERQSRINELKALLDQEITDRQRLMITEDEEKESGSCMLEEQENTSDAGDSDLAVENYEEEEFSPYTGDDQTLGQIRTLNNLEEPDVTSEEMQDASNSNEMGVERNESVNHSIHHRSLERIPSLNSPEPELLFEEPEEGAKKSDEMMIETCGRNVAESTAVCITDRSTGEESSTASGMSKFLENAKSAETLVQGSGATEDVWSTVSMVDRAYYNESHDYAPMNKLPMTHQKVEEQPARMINLEEDIIRDEDEQILCRPDDNVGSSVQANRGPAFFDVYTDNGRGQLVSEPQLLKEQQPYPGQHVDGMKQENLFSVAGNNTSDAFHYSQHLHEQQQQQMLEQRQAGEKELYTLHLMQKNMYDYTGKRPNREDFTPTTSSLDWETDSVRMLPLQPLAAGEMLDHHWGSCGSRTYSNWPGLDIPVTSQGQCPGDGSAGDGGFFSFVPHWNGLMRTSYDSVSSEQYVGPSAYGGGAGSEGDGIQCQGHNAQFTYVNQQYGFINPHEDTTRHKTVGSMAWMNMPLAAGVNSEMMHQNSLTHDSLGKPFLGSWNQ